jgi:hypothetical protein
MAQTKNSRVKCQNQGGECGLQIQLRQRMYCTSLYRRPLTKVGSSQLRFNESWSLFECGAAPMGSHHKDWMREKGKKTHNGKAILLSLHFLHGVASRPKAS